MSPRRTDRLRPVGVLSHLGAMVAVAAVMGVLVAGIAIPFAAVAGLGSRTLSDGVDKIPAQLAAEPLAQRTRLLGRDGAVLATLYDQNRVNVPLSKVAPVMRKAIIAIEDYRFYQHGALDLRGTLRAFVTNQANNGTTQGGSSITQQMVKMTLVNQARTKAQRQAATAETYQRKIAELRYAIAFEQKYSKDWILQRYLNIAYFGDGAYGIEAASRHYFSKPASQLNLREAATLAGLVKNPTGYDPTNYKARAKARRNIVIARMAQLNVVSPAVARHAEHSSLGLKVTQVRNGCSQSPAPFFCDFAIQYLLADRDLGKTEEERRRLLFNGGLTIKTTVDLRDQRAADASVARHVHPTDQAIGGLATVEPGTGEVRSLAQSRPMGSDKAKGQTYLNYLVPRKYGDARGFQAGSTFKAFVLATAITQGIPLSTRINAPQTVSIPESRYRTCDGYLHSADTWNPQNSTGVGTFNLYTGHPAVGEHLLRPARGAHGPVRADDAGQEDGRRRPRQRHRRAVHARRHRRRPADHGQRLRDVRGTRALLRTPSGHRGAEQRGQDDRGLPRPVQAAGARRRRRCRQRHPQGRAGARRLRVRSGARARASSRRARPARRASTRPSGSSATPRTSRLRR